MKSLKRKVGVTLAGVKERKKDHAMMNIVEQTSSLFLVEATIHTEALVVVYISSEL